MKKELVNEFVSKLESNMKSIEKVINDNLGLNIKMRVVTSGRYDINVNVEEFEGNEVEAKPSIPPSFIRYIT